MNPEENGRMRAMVLALAVLCLLLCPVQAVAQAFPLTGTLFSFSPGLDPLQQFKFVFRTFGPFVLTEVACEFDAAWYVGPNRATDTTGLTQIAISKAGPQGVRTFSPGFVVPADRSLYVQLSGAPVNATFCTAIGIHPSTVRSL